MIQRNEVDIGATDFYITLSRSKAVDLSTVLGYDK